SGCSQVESVDLGGFVKNRMKSWPAAIPFLLGAAMRATVCDSVDSSAIPDLEQIVVRQYTTRSYPSLRPIIWVSATFGTLKTPDTIYQPDWWLARANWRVIVNNK